MSKLLNFVALSGFVAISAIVSGPAPVAALAVEGVHVARNNAHHGIAKRSETKLTKRCKARTTPAPSSSSSSEQAAATTSASAAASSDSANNSGSSSSSGSSGNAANVGEFSQLGWAWTMSADLLPAYKQGKTALMYNWAETGPEADGFEFAPMLWGDKNVDAFIAATNKKTPSYALMCNEPELNNDSGLSSGLSPQAVVDVYWKAMDPLVKKGVQILTPAVTSGPAGLTWMGEFMGLCNGCNFAGQALHFYDITADAAIAHFKEHHSKWNLPIYNTEIAFQNFNGDNQLSAGDAAYQMGLFNDWVKGEGASFMKVVMYFGFQDDMVNVNPQLQLIDTSSGKPNWLGQTVIDQLGQ